MGIGSALSGALGGVGRSMVSLSNKYIDEELAANRAKMLADLQLEGERKREEYQQSDEVQGRRNKNAATAALSTAEAQRQGVVAGANDTAYQGALDTNSQLAATRAGTATATQLGIETPAKVAAANQTEDGTRDGRVATQAALTKVQTDGQIRVAGAQKAAAGGGSALDKIKPADKERLEGIGAELKQITEQVVKAKAADGGWNPQANPGQQELSKRAQQLQLQRDAILASYSNDAGLSDLLKRLTGPAPAGDKPAPAAAGDKPQRAAPKPEPTYQERVDASMQDRSDEWLAKVANHKGHPEQAKARAELKRREDLWNEEQKDTPTSGFGFGA